MSPPERPSGWFVTTGTARPGAARVFCFGYAGGDPRTYLDWQPALSADAELVAVCPPGRGHRAGEAAPGGIDHLIAAAAEAIGTEARHDERPVHLFGHSLGGLVAFEVARRLRWLPRLRHLVVSGISAPSLLPSRRVRELAALDGEEFARALAFFGGLPADLLADPDVLALLLPGLTADFRMAVGYRYRRGDPLEIGVSVVTGRADPHVGPEQVRPWRRECRAAPSYHWADGGHFYFDGQPAAVTDLLRALVRADQHVELI